VLWAASFVALLATARAAELTGSEIKALLYGKAVHLQTTAVSANGKVVQGVIYSSEDGTAPYKTPDGTVMHGKSEIEDNTNRT
jgi:hypothetical protein